MTHPPDAGWRLRLADGELAAIEPGADGLVLRLAAAPVWRPGPPPQAGHLSGVRIVLRGVATPPAVTAGRLSEGRVWCGGTWHHALPLPGQLTGPLRLELGLPFHTAWQVEAAAILLELDAGARFQESMAC